MSAPLSVRPLAEGDLPRAAAIEATAPEAWAEAALLEELQSESGRLYGLWSENALQGVTVFQLVLDEASLLTLTVDPSARRLGFGRALLEGAFAALAGEGAHLCFLEVRSQNAPALALYRALGFSQVGRRRGFYQNPPDDALVLSRELTGPGESAGR